MVSEQQKKRWEEARRKRIEAQVSQDWKQYTEEIQKDLKKVNSYQEAFLKSPIRRGELEFSEDKGWVLNRPFVEKTGEIHFSLKPNFCR